MPAIIKEISIAAAPERVFNALTQQEELAHWWTDDLSMKPEVGYLAEFRFATGFFLQFEIMELKANENITWVLRQGPPDWIETNVTWQLTPIQKGTTLFFMHDGFMQVNNRYEQARKNWSYFLDSLKSYLETGKGTPGCPAAH